MGIVAVLGLGIEAPARAIADVVFTNTAHITVANRHVETGGDTSDNPLVVNGPVGQAIAYVPSALNGGCCGDPYGDENFDDDDVGAGVPSDGFYAIPNEGRLNLDFPFPTAPPIFLGSIAIYYGYADRADGDYILENGFGGETLGAWTIFGTNGASNDSVDSFWLTFNRPVYTFTLSIIASSVENGTPSYREIDVFAPVPEPSALLMGAMVALILAAGGTCRWLRVSFLQADQSTVGSGTIL